MPSDNDVQKMLDSLLIAETRVLLKDLADHFTENTKRIAVPYGTKFFRALAMRPSGLEKIQVPLHRFFGMVIGYNSELDLLVICQSKDQIKMDKFDRLFDAIKSGDENLINNLACDLFITESGNANRQTIEEFEQVFPEVKISPLDRETHNWFVGAITYEDRTYPYG